MVNYNGKLVLGSTQSSRTFKKLSGETSSINTGSLKTMSTIWIGTGITPPTADDYTLESRNTDVTQISTSCVNASTYGDNFAVTVSSTYSNNTSSDITITELGVIGNYNTSGSEVMIAREVIDPVVIPANGGQKTFTITIG